MPGAIRRSRYHGYGNGNAPHQNQKHYYANGAWIHPYEFRPSCYSDFVPCNYAERTIVSRIYKYVRALLAQTNGTILQRRSSSTATRGWADFEMISTSPSPTLCANPAAASPTTLYRSQQRDGSYRPSKLTAANSPRPYIRPPPAVFARQSTQSPVPLSKPSKRPRSTSTQGVSSPAVTKTVDAGTQYSPLLAPTAKSSPEGFRVKGKRRETSPSPKEIPNVPAEPSLEPQMSVKRSGPSTSWADSNTTSSTTLVKNSSTTSSSSQGTSPKRARPPKRAVKVMPVQYETCDVKDLVVLISNMLMELVRFNDDIPLKDGRLTRFHSRAPPGISIKDYLQRLTTHATLSPPILLSMVYYIDRLCALYPAFTISSLTVHRFLITSATVASKGLSDSFWTNSLYARVGGVSLKELALLELEFLWRVEWRIVPKPEVLVDYYRSLVERSEDYQIEGSRAGSKSGSSRGSDVSVGDMKLDVPSDKVMEYN
ncbi:MAG: hypothetical protein LQ343_006513 [Gyalolechia ehrenbergii]|nr:MAG: hypothetical protein LQ343_006513 [Gyalolechia ehrenbergii]